MQILHQLSKAVPSSYADHAMNSVEVWALLIAAVVLAIEWIVSRR